MTDARLATVGHDLRHHQSVSMKKTVYLAMIIWLAALIYFGLRSFMESQVISSTIDLIAGSDIDGVKPIMSNSVYISRPMKCVPETSNVIDDSDLNAYRMANKDNARPIYLRVLEGVVPIMSKEDTKRIFRAGYNWEALEYKTVWVSRVGFSWLLDRASICVRFSHSPHGKGALVILVRDGFNWSVSQELLANW